MSLRDDRGFTLIELLVAMTIGMIVLGAALTIVTVSTNASRRVQQRTDATARGRVGTEQVLRPLHAITCAGGGPALVYASPSLLAFNADLTAAAGFTPVQHSVGIVTSGGVTSVQQGDYTPAALATSATTTAPAWPANTMRNLVNDISTPTAGTPLFTYYGPSADGSTLVQLNASPSLSVADLANVARIDVSFASQASETGTKLAAPVVYTSSVFPREDQMAQSTAFPVFGC
jgi:prepilin-type N-terminal cleavage/methylation domain-containing protein